MLVLIFIVSCHVYSVGFSSCFAVLPLEHLLATLSAYSVVPTAQSSVHSKLQENMNNSLVSGGSQSPYESA